MKTIQLQIDDKNYDSFMTILNNLKKGFKKTLVLKTTTISKLFQIMNKTIMKIF